MTVTLDLETEEVAALTARADAQGVNIETVLHRLVEQMAPMHEEKPKLTQKQQAALARLDSWAVEKTRLTPDELAENDTEFEEFKSNVNRWRIEEGREPAFR